MSNIYDASTGIAVAVGANTAIGLAATKPTLLLGYVLLSGTAAASITFLNGSGGTARWGDSNILTAVAGDQTKTIVFKTPIIFPIGLYVTLSGTAATAYVQYQDVMTA